MENVVISARTMEVDLYGSAEGQRIRSLAADDFPACLPISKLAPNGMVEVIIEGKSYWIPPFMISYRIAGRPNLCRNLASGNNNAHVGATRELGEGCGVTHRGPASPQPRGQQPINPCENLAVRNKDCPEAPK